MGSPTGTSGFHPIPVFRSSPICLHLADEALYNPLPARLIRPCFVARETIFRTFFCSNPVVFASVATSTGFRAFSTASTTVSVAFFLVGVGRFGLA